MNYVREQIKIIDLMDACLLPVNSTKEEGYENTLVKILCDIMNNTKLSYFKEKEYASIAIYTLIGVQKTEKMMMVVSGEETVLNIYNFLNNEHIDTNNITITCITEYVEKFVDNIFKRKKKMKFIINKKI
jgi:hypothetical protein